MRRILHFKHSTVSLKNFYLVCKVLDTKIQENIFNNEKCLKNNENYKCNDINNENTLKMGRSSCFQIFKISQQIHAFSSISLLKHSAINFSFV